jgi:zinc D-Ala-D-Ala dipeptidase
VRRRFVLLLASAVTIATVPASGGAQAPRPADIVDLTDAVPGIRTEIRYFGSHNFVGRPISGYRAEKCLLTRAAANALAGVQAALREFDLALKVYDCYRPQTAVDDFVEWGRDLRDQAMKLEFYPTVDKSSLFSDGYIAERSGHSRASTVDLTIVPGDAPPSPAFDRTEPLRSCENDRGARHADSSIDMGTGYDCFSELSHTTSTRVGAAQRANRLLLKSLMERAGFRSLPEEWWHYTLADEPYPATYFAFPVE